MLHSTVLGIDVSKDKLDCSLVNADLDERLWYLSVPNNVSGIAQLLARTDSSVPLVMEPTGRYSLLLAQESAAAHRTLYLAPPRKAKDFRRSLQSRAKTDNIDSYSLALFGASRRLSRYPIKSESVEHLDSLLAYRKLLSGNISRMRLQSKSLPMVADRIEADLLELKTRLADLDKEIRRVVRTTPQFAIASQLEKIPGFGSITSAAIGCRLVNKDFSHPDQFVAYVGLDVGVIQSGKRSSQFGLTKQGDAELRRLLYCAAQASLRAKDSPFKQQYDRERAKGHLPKQALCAVARKMAKVAWSIVRHQAQYDPSRVFVQPRAQSAGLTPLTGGSDGPLVATSTGHERPV